MAIAGSLNVNEDKHTLLLGSDTWMRWLTAAIVWNENVTYCSFIGHVNMHNSTVKIIVNVTKFLRK